MSLEQMRDRIKDVLPEDEIPVFFDALEEHASRPRKSIRFNPLRPGSQEFWSQLSLPLLDPVPWIQGGYFIPREVLDRPEVRLFQAAGLGYVQEASAMEVAPALEATRADRVLDLCAAPGGKATQLGEILGAQGWICSNEVDRDRARLLDAMLMRQGIVRSTVFSLFPGALAERYPNFFTRILLDAPCSSESFFAKRSEKRQDVTRAEVRRCARKQRKILESAAALSAPVSRLVYSTCTYSREENEEVIAHFLAENPSWTCLKEVRRFPHRDRVPGGYFAILARSDGDEEGASDDSERVNEFHLQGSWNGVVRNGARRWDGSQDGYALAMSGSMESNDFFMGQEDLTTEEALYFCSGRTPSSIAGSRERRVITWNGFPIGAWDPKREKSSLLLPRPLIFGSMVL